ncbi:hypothetical protein Ae201684P_019815 [Aphanomyces euteiches]|uniref:Uncharacterized protein n=1 Tax=Aphanomyces euteiches TaxID=100861 RepID=A0A6G0XEB0_9STRA|nr:hypothetical protein Ae201684_005631 [Aphanomyces euteiches]KAH9078741.1 hypothetical protein Ae201684P_019815 [Aphanomyces euteiches]
MRACFFNGCNNAAEPDSFKCLFHSHRGRCRVEDCHNQVYARNLCVRHGGKRQCAFEGCLLNSRVGPFCTRHSPSEAVRRCSQENCSNQAHLNGRCFRHGGNRFCKIDGCVTYARNRGYCTRHTPRPIAPKSPSKPNIQTPIDAETAQEDKRALLPPIDPSPPIAPIEPTMDDLSPHNNNLLPNHVWNEVIRLLAEV